MSALLVSRTTIVLVRVMGVSFIVAPNLQACITTTQQHDDLGPYMIIS
ncbi:predicted protein [Plenodomus lingam JN3]|uniref:Predicted protein n=1 Tax=Leptosphaeria maculans (strain JN3 / isolate v23.1.3 / race Av1-4-5-6-7-8) TaxID=985895 RepID=E5A954_LEPMJ|nr:predicted protein [Plenodomus lingam JN3]CBY00195.1 predicted protein [Plenodomus lingam JN3]